VSAQQVADLKLFLERTQAEYRYVSAQLKDLSARLVLLQIEAQKNANVAALLKDTNDRIQTVQEALNRIGGK
jgi:hypothetical protein